MSCVIRRLTVTQQKVPTPTPPFQFYPLDTPISHWQLLWDILSQLAGKTREVTTVPPASLPPERGKRNTVNDCCPVTLYSPGNMATQIVYRQWNGQSVFLCKINSRLHISQNIVFRTLKKLVMNLASLYLFFYFRASLRTEYTVIEISIKKI